MGSLKWPSGCCDPRQLLTCLTAGTWTYLLVPGSRPFSAGLCCRGVAYLKPCSAALSFALHTLVSMAHTLQLHSTIYEPTSPKAALIYFMLNRTWVIAYTRCMQQQFCGMHASKLHVAIRAAIRVGPPALQTPSCAQCWTAACLAGPCCPHLHAKEALDCAGSCASCRMLRPLQWRSVCWTGCGESWGCQDWKKAAGLGQVRCQTCPQAVDSTIWNCLPCDQHVALLGHGRWPCCCCWLCWQPSAQNLCWL